MFTKLESALKGYKTYIVAFLMVVIAVVNFVAGDSSVTDLLNDPNLMILLNGAGLAALRAGVAKGAVS